MTRGLRPSQRRRDGRGTEGFKKSINYYPTSVTMPPPPPPPPQPKPKPKAKAKAKAKVKRKAAVKRKRTNRR